MGRRKKDYVSRRVYCKELRYVFTDHAEMQNSELTQRASDPEYVPDTRPIETWDYRHEVALMFGEHHSVLFRFKTLEDRNHYLATVRAAMRIYVRGDRCGETYLMVNWASGSSATCVRNESHPDRADRKAAFMILYPGTVVDSFFNVT